MIKFASIKTKKAFLKPPKYLVIQLRKLSESGSSEVRNQKSINVAEPCIAILKIKNKKTTKMPIETKNKEIV